MKGILIFRLPQERDEFETAQDGAKHKAILEDFYAYLRTKEKYEDKESLTIDEIREKLNELRVDYD